MFCSRCGVEQPEAARFCERCGHRHEVVPSRRAALWWIGGAVAVALALAGAAVLVATGTFESDDAGNSQVETKSAPAPSTARTPRRSGPSPAPRLTRKRRAALSSPFGRPCSERAGGTALVAIACFLFARSRPAHQPRSTFLTRETRCVSPVRFAANRSTRPSLATRATSGRGLRKAATLRTCTWPGRA